MSSVATFYIVPERKREAFARAREGEKAVAYKPRFFGLLGRKAVETGGEELWEFLDREGRASYELPYSGFVVVDYFLTYVELPEGLRGALAEGTSADGHYLVFDHGLAAGLVEYLDAHPPDEAGLAEFAREQGQDAGEYGPLLRETHDHLADWLHQVGAEDFGVMHLTF